MQIVKAVGIVRVTVNHKLAAEFHRAPRVHVRQIHPFARAINFQNRSRFNRRAINLFQIQRARFACADQLTRRMSKNIYERMVHCLEDARSDFFARLIQRAVRGCQHNVIAREQIVGQVERTIGVNFYLDTF